MREVLLAPVGRVYLSESVSELNLTHWLISTQAGRRSARLILVVP